MSVPVLLLKEREQHTRRIWVLQTGHWQNPAKYLSTDFRLLHTWRLDHGDLRIWLYERETLTLRDVDPVHGHHPSYGGLL